MKQFDKQSQFNHAVLGIEFGSTRIKTVLINDQNQVISQGSHLWENQLDNGIWTYSEQMIWQGLQSSYLDLKKNIKEKYGITLSTLKAIGISGMMHGYIALDEHDLCLVPFRTWRNTITKQASESLTSLFSFAIPQRWTIAHLYQSILNRESHVQNIASLTTLSGFVHYKLTDQFVVGIGEASGIFPIDTKTKDYDQVMLNAFNDQISNQFPWTLKKILPKVLLAGEQAGTLSLNGSLLLDPSGDLKPGIPLCPPEGDASTGMISTNAIKKRTGNISAGTSVFAMIVTEKAITKPYDTVDVVTTPMGDSVAMVHVNNCTSDINAWIEFIKSTLNLFEINVEPDQLYQRLFQSALTGDSVTGDLLTYNYYSGEHITDVDQGRLLLIRKPNSTFNISNVMKANLFSAMTVLRIGMDLLQEKEQIQIDSIVGHGGLFKTPLVGQKILASALKTPVTVMETAGEGGSYGMAILANYMVHKNQFDQLQTFLDQEVFNNAIKHIEHPDQKLMDDFDMYLQKYKKGLAIEKQAIKSFK